MSNYPTMSSSDESIAPWNEPISGEIKTLKRTVFVTLRKEIEYQYEEGYKPSDAEILNNYREENEDLSVCLEKYSESLEKKIKDNEQSGFGKYNENLKSCSENCKDWQIDDIYIDGF